MFKLKRKLVLVSPENDKSAKSKPTCAENEEQIFWTGRNAIYAGRSQVKNFSALWTVVRQAPLDLKFTIESVKE